MFMNKITLFYSKKNHEKYYNLRVKKSHISSDLSIKINFPNLYEHVSQSKINFLQIGSCECDICLSKICVDYDFNIKHNSFEERKKCALMKTILKCKIKNKIYNCVLRIKTIIDCIKNFALENPGTNIAIFVPNQIETINKIKCILVEHSEGSITKNKHNLRSFSSDIYLISPIISTYGFDIKSFNVGLVLMNAFYYHMFARSLEYEELICEIWRCKLCEPKFIMISDSKEIFKSEHETFFKLCDDLKISYG